MKKLLLFILILNFSLPFCFGNNSSFISVKNILKSKHLAQEAIIYEDSASVLKLENFISNNALAINSIKSDSEVPYMDFTSSTYWMKLLINNDTTIDQTYHIELARPLTNVVNLYVLDEENKLVQSFFSGDNLPFNQRPSLNRKFIFPITLSANSKNILIVEAKSDGEILELPIKFWKIDSFIEFSTKENFFLGLYYGLFILVIVLFTFFGVALRQKLYVYFVSYVLSLGLFQFALDGLAYQYFWSGSPWMGNHSILIFAAISMLSMLLYVKKFLEFSDEHKIYLRLYNLFILLVSICLISSLTSGLLYSFTFPVLNGLSFIIIFYFLIGIYLKYKEGNKPEFPITIAFVVLCVSSILFILANVNLIESEFLAANALKLGSAIEVTFLSMAMAIRYRKTQDEKVEAQEVAFKRLEELNKFKSEQTAHLEKEVELRTIEIVEKNRILSSKNEEIINSITYAKRLQDAILPSNKLLDACFKKSSIFFKPKDIVSGDFYWLETTDTHAFFAVADCTGHGVPGALVSVVGYNALNRCINEMGLSEPGEILDKLTSLVELNFSKNDDSVSDGMDICLCRWDFKNEIKYAGAYNSLYLIKDNEVQEITGDRQPIGKFITRKPFTTKSISVSEKDAIILFSDGFPDQFGGEKGKKLKYSNFKKIILNGESIPYQEFKSFLNQELLNWQGKEEQIDDICVMKVGF